MYVNVQKEVDSKGLACVIMEDEQSLHLLPASLQDLLSWRFRKAEVYFQSKLKGLRTRGQVV